MSCGLCRAGSASGGTFISAMNTVPTAIPDSVIADTASQRTSIRLLKSPYLEIAVTMLTQLDDPELDRTPLENILCVTAEEILAEQLLDEALGASN